MSPVLYVLAIMGCGDDSAQCQQARLEPVQYTSIQACQEAMPGALGRSTDLEYPVITAACRRQTPEMVQTSAPVTQRRGG
jgi:hypothetical protein